MVITNSISWAGALYPMSHFFLPTWLWCAGKHSSNGLYLLGSKQEFFILRDLSEGVKAEVRSVLRKYGKQMCTQT